MKKTKKHFLKFYFIFIYYLISSFLILESVPRVEILFSLLLINFEKIIKYGIVNINILSLFFQLMYRYETLFKSNP